MFNPCPECGGNTWPSSKHPVPLREAISRRNHAMFEDWLDEHNRRDPVEELERIPVQSEAS